jgi:hypothetical protein
MEENARMAAEKTVLLIATPLLLMVKYSGYPASWTRKPDNNSTMIP